MTTTPKPPRPPTGLARRGGTFWRRTTTAYVLDDSELQLLVEVCRALDECEALHAVVQDHGATVKGSRGQVIAHPALSELRQTRLVVSRLVKQLALPPDDDAAALTVPQLRASKAARARWTAQRRKGVDRGAAS